MYKSFPMVQDTLVIYKIKTKIWNTQQHNISIISYYNLITNLWQKMDLHWNLHLKILKWFFKRKKDCSSYWQNWISVWSGPCANSWKGKVVMGEESLDIWCQKLNLWFRHVLNLTTGWHKSQNEVSDSSSKSTSCEELWYTYC